MFEPGVPAREILSREKSQARGLAQTFNITFMKIIVGLGNPGEKYIQTRHNTGFRVIDILALKLEIKLKKRLLKGYELGKTIYNGKPLFLVKPLTYMNNSGRIISDILNYTHLNSDELVVICDNLDLPIGTVKMKVKGSSAGHKGLASIIRHLSTEQFMRIYIGIGKPENRYETVSYVLGVPLKNEMLLQRKAEEIAAESILNLYSATPEQVMNELNIRKTSK